MFKKLFYIVLFLLIILGVYYLGIKYFNLKPSPTVQKVLPFLKNQNYVKGSIIVVFYEGESEEGTSLLEGYDLKYRAIDENSDEPLYFEVEVPEGEELEWIEKLGKKSIIRTAELNTIQTID